MARVVLDADVVIAFLDRENAQHELAVQRLDGASQSEAYLFMAASSHAEILVQPMRDGAEGVIDGFFESLGIEVVPLDAPITRQAARLRSQHTGLRLADALGVAAERVLHADFITLDTRLQRILESTTP